jgi:hypothetical protein
MNRFPVFLYRAIAGIDILGLPEAPGMKNSSKTGASVGGRI